MISTARYWFYIGLIVLVYIIGMFVTLFENDSAQFAVMAMRMVQENDFLSLFKGTEEYLDKPHMHYWLAAISYKIFGIHDWAYRIPGILSTLLGAYSCYGLGKLLYNKDVGRFASLIFMTAQTMVLANIDVRTDAVLTGFTIFSIWQLVSYIEKSSLKSIALGAFGAGIAFSTKGQIALVVIGISILCHLIYTRKWQQLFNWKVLVAILVFGVTIAPMLYAYYHQFDLHPEKVIRGKDNRSGIFFIFWEQSFERMSGEGVGKNSSDFFFFFHTFLWVFLPWTVLALIGYWTKLKAFWETKFAYRPDLEFLTVGGISILFLLISFAQFKLPHYMNILMPLYTILSAAFLYMLHQKEKLKMAKVILGIQYFILGLVVVFTILVSFYVFKLEHWYNYLLLLMALGLVMYFIVQKEAPYTKIVTVAIFSSVLLNGLMNAHFYPKLLEYQGGSTMAEQVKENNIPVDRIYKISERYSWSLDFYNKKPVQITSLSEIANKNDVWVYVTDKELEQLRKNGIVWDEQITVDQFRITRLQTKFLNPNTRAGKLNKMHLVQLD
ncbi:glycosyl transferase family 39 [Allomuricauda ruestringensis DSM 13258]|uniref:Glycosyl transferase family 39 n=1 Tax=Allomuricauda ruestringensis (strain DSM 13258 / CIP 107369 / LMG 19739 / B1) TaxID=886377 RepID=G2PSC4_ALLRU|nr:glycosyltransferase family 39 protein [Allomuricauda ruestringensis]AEM69381.1 glycosyl transferase family 39 [Allomuricauda ruestringensis DSM 13258]